MIKIDESMRSFDGLFKEYTKLNILDENRLSKEKVQERLNTYHEAVVELQRQVESWITRYEGEELMHKDCMKENETLKAHKEKLVKAIKGILNNEGFENGMLDIEYILKNLLKEVQGG